MMNYSNDFLDKLEEMATNMMTPSEASFLLGVDEVTLKDDINTIGHPARMAYMRGLSQTALDMRKDIRTAAMAGSPYSIAECQRLIISITTSIQ